MHQLRLTEARRGRAQPIGRSRESGAAPALRHMASHWDGRSTTPRGVGRAEFAMRRRTQEEGDLSSGVLLLINLFQPESYLCY